MGVPFDLMNQVFPTSVVHAYYDTGRTITVEGQSYRWLEPQTSFGYYVYHEGETSGWSSALDGATKIAPNYYLVEVPEGGSAIVKTTIIASQPGLRDFCASLKFASAGPLAGGLLVAAIFAYWPVVRKRMK
jgi:hypothetical protein